MKPASDRVLFLEGRVVVTVDDITRHAVDAIVNAANSSLLGGGGVDGAIHRAGGSLIIAACRRIRETEFPDGLPTGSAVITPGGNLPARYVIHTVGPIYQEHGSEAPALLADSYRNSLLLARKHSLETIAFPSISTGVYGYPKAEAAIVVSQTVEEFLKTDNTLKEIRLVFFDLPSQEVFVANQRFSDVPSRT